MKRPLRVLPVLLAVATLFGAEAERPLTVAVFDFVSKDSSTKELAPQVSAVLSALLSAEENLVMVERAELEKALGEQELGLSGTIAADSAARLGHLTGAKVLITGSVFKSGNRTMVVAKIIGTETSRVFAETANANGSPDANTLAEPLAKKMAATISSKADALVAKVEDRDVRVQRLINDSKTAHPRAISVSVPEQHFGAHVADPAAQTELLSILQRAGYEIVDAKSTRKADVEIAGEAFSAFALRKGNLQACKARIELTARAVADGRILFTGSQTTVAVDIAEQTAAKTALETAALTIAERMLPALRQER